MLDLLVIIKMNKNKKLGRETINYLILSVIIIILAGVSVYSLSAGGEGNPGHNLATIAPPSSCNEGEVLQWQGSSWSCTLPTSNKWLSGSDGTTIYRSEGKVGMGGEVSAGDVKLLVNDIAHFSDEVVLAGSGPACSSSAEGLMVYSAGCDGDMYYARLKVCMQEDETTYAYNIIQENEVHNIDCDMIT